MSGNNAAALCALSGPLTLITVGVLFAINNFTPVGFDKTWPVILIVFGLITLICRGAAKPVPPQAYPGVYPYPQQPGYSQTPYQAPPASGTSSPNPSDEQGQTPRGGSL